MIFSTVPPKLNPFPSTVLQLLNVGDRASLTCSVIKGDLPLTITWRKDNRIIDASQHISIKQVDHYNSILVIENLGPDHTGNYSCHVRNSAAEVEIAQSLLVNGKEYTVQKKKLNNKKIDLFLFVLLVEKFDLHGRQSPLSLFASPCAFFHKIKITKLTSSENKTEQINIYNILFV